MPEKENIVKARFHYGSNSMDLTIPTAVVNSMGIKDGDLFRVTTKEEDDRLVIEYERIYKAKQKAK